MRAKWKHENEVLVLTLLPDIEDPLTSDKPPYLRMMTNVATFKFPEPIHEPHPDLLALAAYSVAWPWAKRRMRFDRPISAAMSEAFLANGIDATCPNSDEPSARQPGQRVSLAYSGGADSIATAEVLPSDTAFVHLRRTKHPRVVNRMTHVRVDVIESLVRQAGKFDRDVSVVQTDLEYLCLPFATYPVWWAISIASILTADHCNAGAVALGTVLESRYTANGTKWGGKVPPSPTHKLYSAAGIPMMRPATGMTEVTTTRLSLESPLGHLARSCLLGTLASACLSCDKCLRKEMIAAAVTDEPLPKQLLANMSSNPQMMLKVNGPLPIYFQDMVEYALARIDVHETSLAEVKDRLQPSIENTAWAERYYTPALDDEVPEQFRSFTAEAIARRVEPMSDMDLAIVETWDAAARERVHIS
jgi:hypothetical protein